MHRKSDCVMSQDRTVDNAVDNIEQFQDILKAHGVYSLQGWKDVTEIEICFRLLSDLSEQCGVFIHVEFVREDGDEWRLDSVESTDGGLTVEATNLDQAAATSTRWVECSEIAVSRFALVLLSEHDPSPGHTAGEAPKRIAAVLWHEAFHLQRHHIDELVRHFG
jgi:hypothetical protein